MATKTKEVYICNECGYETSKWIGKCPDCGGVMYERMTRGNKKYCPACSEKKTDGEKK